MYRKFLALSLAICLAAFAAPLHAQTRYPYLLRNLTPEQREDTLKFMRGFMNSVMLHEAGHMLIHELNLPVVGREEDAVDALSTVILLNSPKQELRQSARDAFAGWKLIGDYRVAHGLAPSYWDEHSPDHQRFSNILCLFYGKDTKWSSVTAALNGLPATRAERCPNEYATAENSWNRLLDPHKSTGLKFSNIDVKYYDAADEDAQWWAQFVRDNQFLEMVKYTVSADYKFENGIEFRGGSCEEPNASWDFVNRKMTLCYNFLPFIADIYLQQKYGVRAQ